VSGPQYRAGATNSEDLPEARGDTTSADRRLRITGRWQVCQGRLVQSSQFWATARRRMRPGCWPAIAWSVRSRGWLGGLVVVKASLHRAMSILLVASPWTAWPWVTIVAGCPARAPSAWHGQGVRAHAAVAGEGGQGMPVRHRKGRIAPGFELVP
jgi:hypothetical protein